jgi:deoxyribose-phosphate aldolase
MLDTILEYLEKTGKSVGIKPAGGIRTREQAGVFIALLIEILGKQYFNRENFRIGASSLATDLLAYTGT